MLGLVILTVVVRIVTEGGVSLLSVASIVGIAVGFLVLTAVLGSRIGPPLFRAVQRHSKSAGTLVALALAFTLAFAELADLAQLAPIVGAFVAGLAISRSDQRERIERELTPVGHLFIPVFFLQIGIAVDVSSFGSGTVLGVAAALFVVAVIGKVVAATGAFGAPGDKWLIGFGMIPRGEVGLIFATIGSEGRRPRRGPLRVAAPRRARDHADRAAAAPATAAAPPVPTDAARGRRTHAGRRLAPGRRRCRGARRHAAHAHGARAGPRGCARDRQ